MKKDIALAILIGLVFGMLAAFIVIFLPTITKRQPTTQISAKVSPAVTRTENNTANITIDIKNPPPDSVFTQKSVTLEGSVKNSKLVLLDADSDITILSSSDSGSFKQNLTLTEGSNKFTIVAYDDKGGSTSKTFMLFYTPEKI
ncbi:hypothetical protein A3D77_02595 [Candidatus Gottesmanbacteria bacterium RIFCSPHIGHO2_02_FULL_39_11]|uniref:Bacterial Ig-like domain-containing protein n=1 Tax=Candidatus Gottesmanbacteria bacterium RIFCSPHIGHO2_02_FULL_39_11 TaxID=1798382 RepID=A0A1F5ZTW8_9BACT|nr:MAG: hypothetical protein A3D77_02595 [Candidatus Gottesmanbacteria bacterium RIFCSPHIGHO2_02_FULL_39_11]